MRASDLIRSLDGTEVPAPGRWRIPTSHVTVTYGARTGFIHRVRARAPSASGTLEIADDLGGVSFVLNVGASASANAGDVPSLGALLGDEHLRHVVLRARVAEPTLEGLWRARGEIEIGGVSRPVPVLITYHGVYKSGDDAKAWLTVHAGISYDVAGFRRKGPVELVADLLAVGPPQRLSGDPGRLGHVA